MRTGVPPSADAAPPRLRPRRAGQALVGTGGAGPAESHPDVIASSGVRWLDLERPREADREWLEREFGFHPLAIEDVASRNQRPKLDAYDDYMFLVLHFAVFDKPSGRLLTVELDAFVGPDFVITLPDGPIPPLAAMFERYRERRAARVDVLEGPGLPALQDRRHGVDASFPMLRKMGEKLDRLEDDIFEGRSTRDRPRHLEREAGDHQLPARSSGPMRAVLRDLERTKQRYLAEELDIYFDDITDAAERIWDVLENYKEVVEGLEGTNESVLSHRLNERLRVLTAFSVTLLPLTLLRASSG